MQSGVNALLLTLSRFDEKRAFPIDTVRKEVPQSTTCGFVWRVIWPEIVRYSSELAQPFTVS
jgi:hypothetical protein